MRMRTCFGVVVAAATAFGQSPQPQDITADEAKSWFSVGMSNSRVGDVIENHRALDHGRARTDRDNIVYERFGPIGGAYIVLEYARPMDLNLNPDDKVTKVDITRFEDLRDELPVGELAALSQINMSPSLQDEEFRSVDLIRAVNALVPLGKDEALRLLRAYEAMADDDVLDKARHAKPMDWIRRFRYGIDEERVFFIVRLLFVRRDGDASMPQISSVRPLGSVQLAKGEFPLFPLVLTDDMPFILPFDLTLAGGMESPEVHVRYCEQNCVMRPKLLGPTSSPITSAQVTAQTLAWRKLCANAYVQRRGRNSIRLQALLASGTAGNRWLETWISASRSATDERAEADWMACLGDVQMRSLRWDRGQQRFLPASDGLQR